MKPYGSFVYITTNKRNGTLYVGVTSDLAKRVWRHKQRHIDGFAAKYGLDTLVWYEVHDDIEEAIKREKHIKKWNRAWKMQLIEAANPDWQDLYYIL